MNRFSAHRARLKAQGAARKTAFAEALANGSSVSEASALAGVSQQRGSQYLAEIRKELGPQAK